MISVLTKCTVENKQDVIESLKCVIDGNRWSMLDDVGRMLTDYIQICLFI